MDSNLAVCPKELLAVDPNAAILWTVFLKRVGLHLNGRGEVIENDGRRADIVRRFAAHSLVQRLAVKKTEVERARIWWRESIACSEGASDIPDLCMANMYTLNPFIVAPSLRFSDPRAARLAASKAAYPRRTDAERRAAVAARVRAHRASQRNACNAA